MKPESSLPYSQVLALWVFLNMGFHEEALLAPRPTPKLLNTHTHTQKLSNKIIVTDGHLFFCLYPYTYTTIHNMAVAI